MTFEYGSMYYKHQDNGVAYTREHLMSWSTKELLLMHYYLTMALDGYGHLTVSENTKNNCALFRAVLTERGIDAVANVIDNQKWYDWGYREVSTMARRVS